MNTISSEANSIRVVAPTGMTELVRGSDHLLVAKLAPVVRQHDVALDLAPVERIDAAGIAALISLYHCARENGHNFSVYNVATRIEDILHLVGLDHILVLHDGILAATRQCCVGQPAA